MVLEIKCLTNQLPLNLLVIKLKPEFCLLQESVSNSVDWNTPSLLMAYYWWWTKCFQHHCPMVVKNWNQLRQAAGLGASESSPSGARGQLHWRQLRLECGPSEQRRRSLAQAPKHRLHPAPRRVHSFIYEYGTCTLQLHLTLVHSAMALTMYRCCVSWADSGSEPQTWQTFGARSQPEAVNQLVSQYIEASWISLGKVTQRIGFPLHNFSNVISK